VKRKYNDEHLNESITELKSFKLTIIVTIFATIFSLLTIIISNDLYVICSSLDCIKNFSYYLELPFKIASSGLAIAGFIAIIHRSEQTKSQIKLALDQNKFKNFIDHRAEFYKVITEIENDFKNIKVQNKPLFYKKLFPNNTPHNVEIVSNYIDPNCVHEETSLGDGVSIIEIKPFIFKKRTIEEKTHTVEIEDELDYIFDSNLYYEYINANTARLVGINYKLVELYNKDDERYRTLLVQFIGTLIYCASRLNIISTKNIAMPKKWKIYLTEESPWTDIDFSTMPSDIMNFAKSYIQQDLNLRSFCFPDHSISLEESLLDQPNKKSINQIIAELIIKEENET